MDDLGIVVSDFLAQRFKQILVYLEIHIDVLPNQSIETDFAEREKRCVFSHFEGGRAMLLGDYSNLSQDLDRFRMGQNNTLVFCKHLARKQYEN